MPAIVLPIVVLPQPVSPTTPSTSPRATVSDTPSTARSQPVRRPHALYIGKRVCRSRNSRIAPINPPAHDDTAPNVLGLVPTAAGERPGRPPTRLDNADETGSPMAPIRGWGPRRECRATALHPMAGCPATAAC